MDMQKVVDINKKNKLIKLKVRLYEDFPEGGIIVSNSHKLIYGNNKVFYNKKNEKFTILNKIKTSNERRKYQCIFENGTIVYRELKEIKKGTIKNPNSPSTYGVGYQSIGKYKKDNYKKELILWMAILSRCYNKNDISYKNYGGKNITVDERWQNFQSFANDIQSFDRHNEWKNNDGKYELDKDILCNEKNIVPKIYSKDTCKFVTGKENCKYGNKKLNVTGEIYVGINLDTLEVVEFINKRKFCRDYKVSRGYLSNKLKNNGLGSCSKSNWIFLVAKNKKFKKILQSLLITFSEHCNNCSECKDYSDCILNKILLGTSNIYGVEFI